MTIVLIDFKYLPVSFQIRPPIRLALLSGVAFIIFFSFIASINNISSLSVSKDSILIQQNKQRTQKTDHLETVTKNLNEELNRNNTNETLLRINPTDLQKLEPKNENPDSSAGGTKPSSSKIFITR